MDKELFKVLKENGRRPTPKLDKLARKIIKSKEACRGSRP